MPAARGPAQHQPAAADIGEARFRVARIIDAGGDVGRAVEPVLEVHRQRGQIGLVAGQHDLMHRRLRGRHLDRRQRMAQALAQHRGKASLVGVERGGQAATRSHDVADELRLLRPDRAEPDRIGIAVQHRGHVDQIDRIVVHDAFALLHQFFHEVAQAEFLGVGLGHHGAFSGRARRRLGESRRVPRGGSRMVQRIGCGHCPNEALRLLTQTIVNDRIGIDSAQSRAGGAARASGGKLHAAGEKPPGSRGRPGVRADRPCRTLLRQRPRLRHRRAHGARLLPDPAQCLIIAVGLVVGLRGVTVEGPPIEPVQLRPIAVHHRRHPDLRLPDRIDRSRAHGHPADDLRRLCAPRGEAERDASARRRLGAVHGRRVRLRARTAAACLVGPVGWNSICSRTWRPASARRCRSRTSASRCSAVCSAR